jgi:predicted CXXCH cytochrome family protein
MHNSQDGASMALASQGGAADATPNGALIKFNACAGCHTNTAADIWMASSGIPIVYNTTGYPATSLAGGNFYDGADATHVHTVNGSISSGLAADAITSPPGFKTVSIPSAFTAAQGSNWGPQADTWVLATHNLTCAGTYGCHGDRSWVGGNALDDFGGIRGAHHTDVASLTPTTANAGTTVGKSYRFLAGILSWEQDVSSHEYERDADATNHNGYLGAPYATPSDKTISSLCAECHGVFHSQGGSGIGTGSPWLRHPTDIQFSDAQSHNGEFASGAATYGTTYIIDVPIGFLPGTANATALTGVPASTDDYVVTCLSCHRAHGSPNKDLLRWAYTETDGTGGLPAPAAGHSCRTCHTEH